VAASPNEVIIDPLLELEHSKGKGAHAAPSRHHRLTQNKTHFAALTVVVLQVIAVMFFAVTTIIHYPLWSPVDEGAHFDNIVYIAEHGSYPVLGKALASEQELAIGRGVYPKRTTINPRTDGLAGLSYEAFQPPLYYYLATPLFFLSGNYHTKAIILRFFGLFLLAVSIALFARLSRHVLKERWLLGLAGGLLIYLMPGVIVRMVTISDINLALPLASLIVTELWIAWERRSSVRLLLCGFLVGCGVLTDLYLAELIPVFVLVAATVLWQNRRARDLLSALAGTVIVGLTVLPWLIFNEVKYHSLIASALAKREQLSTVNPNHIRDAIGQVPSLTVQSLFQPVLPQEWEVRFVGHSPIAYLASIFQILIIPGALVLAFALGRRFVTKGYWLLILPWIFNLVACWYIDIGQQWGRGSMVARYTYPTLPFLGLFIVAAMVALFRNIRPLLVSISASSAFLVGLWLFLIPNIHVT
jgi:4-amino-4-deoxy-L-arabinose transferase-like glycosyltransferase